MAPVVKKKTRKQQLVDGVALKDYQAARLYVALVVATLGPVSGLALLADLLTLSAQLDGIGREDFMRRIAKAWSISAKKIARVEA